MLAYSQHAKSQMRKRDISKEDEQFCLENYHTSFTPKEGCLLYFAQHSNGRRIQVVLDTKSNKVVTALWLD